MNTIQLTEDELPLWLEVVNKYPDPHDRYSFALKLLQGVNEELKTGVNMKEQVRHCSNKGETRAEGVCRKSPEDTFDFLNIKL